MDNKSKKQRSQNMAAVKSKDTKPELLVRKALFCQGFRYRLNVRNLPGSPDIVLKRYKTVIFINGCFWHGHNKCKKAVLPETNTDFWKNKIEATKVRDKKRIKEIKKLGWYCIVCWECAILHNRYIFYIDNGHLNYRIRRKVFK